MLEMVEASDIHSSKKAANSTHFKTVDKLIFESMLARIAQ